MKITIDKDNNIKKDGKKVKESQITSLFLEELIEKSLLEEVNYEISKEASDPFVDIIKGIRDNTKKDSAFYKEIKQLEKEQEQNKQEVQKLEKKIKKESDTDN